DRTIVKLLSEISDSLDHQPSPFTILKCLNLQPYSMPPFDIKSNSIPYKVVDYFLKGSSDEKPSIKLSARKRKVN
ncbi:unnamed protein product, partial [Linum tenue]